MWVLIGDVQGVLVTGTVIYADGRARLHGIGYQAVIHQIETRHMRRALEGQVHRAFIAQRPLVAVVVSGLCMQWRADLGLRAAYGSGQHVVNHVHRFRGVFGLLQRFSHHHGHMVANVAHLVDRQNRMRRLRHGRAIRTVIDQPTAGQSPHFSLDVLAGKHRHHAGHRQRALGIYALHVGVGVW